MIQFLPRATVVMLAWGALAFGAVYPWAYWPLAAACAVLGLWGWLAAGRGSAAVDGLTLALVAIVLAMALQLVPLPYDLFVRLAASADRFLDQQYLRYHLLRPETHPLTIAPEATTVALALVAACVVLYTGLARALGLTRLPSLVTRLIVLGVALAVVAIMQHAAIDPESPLVYGFWRPQQRTVPFGPFINRNHFAGWMVMVIPLAIGYSFAVFRSSPRPRQRTAGAWLVWMTRPEASRFALVAFSVLTMAATVVVSGSRSGIASLAVAVVVIGVVVRQRERGSVRGLATIYLTLLLVGAVVWAGAGATLDRFALVSTDLPGRWNAWRDTARIIGDFPAFGVGAGAYGEAMLQYQSFDRHTFYQQAHNEYLEMLAEGGLLVAVPVIIALTLFARLLVQRLRERDEDPVRPWIRLGAAAGLAGIAAQSLVEFSLQMPGNAALLAVIAALATHEKCGSQF